MKDYIYWLDIIDGPAMGETAVDHEMFDEAFEISRKFSLIPQAIKVLLEHRLQRRTQAPRGGEGAACRRRTKSSPGLALPEPPYWCCLNTTCCNGNALPWLESCTLHLHPTAQSSTALDSDACALRRRPPNCGV